MSFPVAQSPNSRQSSQPSSRVATLLSDAVETLSPARVLPWMGASAFALLGAASATRSKARHIREQLLPQLRDTRPRRPQSTHLGEAQLAAYVDRATKIVRPDHRDIRKFAQASQQVKELVASTQPPPNALTATTPSVLSQRQAYLIRELDRLQLLARQYEESHLTRRLGDYTSASQRFFATGFSLAASTLILGVSEFAKHLLLNRTENQ